MLVKKNARTLLYSFLISFIFIGPYIIACNKSEAISPSISNDEISDNSSAAVSEFTSTTTGFVLKEQWNNVSGNDVSQIPFNSEVDYSGSFPSLETPQGSVGNYGVRLRGYITPSITGKYKFYIAADDAGELWLSTNDEPAKKQKIASTLSWTDFRDFNKFSSQRSDAITLKKNHKYYIEILHKQGEGGGNLSIQWVMPGNITETSIPGNRLSPYIPSKTVASPYNVAKPIVMNDAHDITISGKSIIGGSTAAITLTNCSNIHITKNKLYNSSEVGIYLYNCKNIKIDYNYFTNVSTGVYAEQTKEGGLTVNYNQFLNMKGPFPRGQFVQFNNVNGPNNSISYNKGENIFGQSYPEDGINLYQSSGTASSPIQINENWIRGGGPSSSGGGIMLGDKGGSYLTATNNILVDPGEYGMAIAGGDHNVIKSNLIYGRQQYFTNVGLYVNSIGGYNVTNAIVSDNKVNYFNAANYNNNAWLAPGVDKPEGWDGNLWGAKIDASILPKIIINY